jgi:hypothetical protein
VVSVIGNVATVTVSLFGRRTLHEQIERTESVELAKVEADAERVRDERREQARRERRDVYARFLTVISRVQEYGGDDPSPTDEERERTNREFEFVYSEILLAGAKPVCDEAASVLAVLHGIGAHMLRFEGGTAARFGAAYRQHDNELPFDQRGDAIAAAKGGLVSAMRNDVTAPHLPEQ